MVRAVTSTSLRAAAIVAVVLSAATVRADAVVMQQITCPPGAYPQPSHDGVVCAPSRCRTAADCEQTRPWGVAPGVALDCVPRALCIETHSVTSRSGWSHGQSYEREVVTADCHETRVCEGTSECIEERRCVTAGRSDLVSDPAKSLEPPPPRGCELGLYALVPAAIVIGLFFAFGPRTSRPRTMRDEIVDRAKRSQPLSRRAIEDDLGERGGNALDALSAEDPSRVRIAATLDGDLLYEIVPDGGAEPRRGSKRRNGA